MNISTLSFGTLNLRGFELEGRRVLEVGSQAVNGSLRRFSESRGTAEYVGVDIESGPGVDEVCDVADLETRFGSNSFDVVICTEVMEHVRDWRSAIHNLKAVCKPGGFVLVTTRSPGFPYHAWPHDYWRFDLGDWQKIWSDFDIDVIETDPLAPGVYVKAHKPADFVENDLSGFDVWCLPARGRAPEVTQADLESRYFKSLHWRKRLQTALTAVKARVFGDMGDA